MRWTNGILALLLTLPALAVINWKSAGAFTPDTRSYLNFLPFRQPLYGLLANGIHDLFGSWEAVGQMQILCLLCALAVYYLEIARCGRWGRLGALLAATVMLLVLRLGIASLIPILMTEGLFIPGLVLLSALVLRMGRLRRVGWEGHLAILVLFALVQLRPAAMLTLCIPPLAVLLLLRLDPGRSSRVTGGRLMATFVILVTCGPLLQGKRFLQVGSRGDSLGFALIGKISQLLPPVGDPSVPRDWTELARSWQVIAKGLDLTEAALFDGQIQEAIRFGLAPRLLFSSTAPGTRSDAGDFDWAKESDRRAARHLSLRWITADPMAYARWSLIHFVGTMTAATYPSGDQRQNVFAGIRAIDQRTWSLAPLRNDYPNNRFDLTLERRTAIVNVMVRGFAWFMLIAGAATAVLLLCQTTRRQRPSAATTVASTGWFWLCAHGAVVGLTVFPEFRYVYTTLLGYACFSMASAVLAIYEAATPQS